MTNEKSNRIRKRSFGTTMGVTSIIAILVILVLVVFSTLSLITAKADLSLSQKTADNIKAYYVADGKAEEMIGELCDIATSSGKVKEYADDHGLKYEDGDDGKLIKFTISIDDSRTLNAEVLIDDDGNPEKKLWQIVPAKEWEQDNKIELIQP